MYHGGVVVGVFLNLVAITFLNPLCFRWGMSEKRKDEKKVGKKDPFEEIIEILEGYEEGTPPRKIDDWGE